MTVRPVASIATIVWVLAGTAALAGVIRSIGIQVGQTFHFGQLWLTLGAATFAVLLVRALSTQDPPVTGFRLPISSEAPPRPFADVSRWEDRLSWSMADPERFALSVHPRLRELTATRLRLHHNVDPDNEPDRAMELLDPTLRAFVTNPPTNPPDASTLADMVRRIEEL